MARVLIPAAFLLAVVAAAAADEILLADGRTFTGSATLDGDTVQLEMNYGTVSFPRDEVVRIDYRDTPRQALLRKLSEAPRNDPNALFQIAQWAAENNLPQQAEALYADILKLDPNHAATRRRLQQIRIDGTWLSFPDAAQRAESMLQAGRSGELLTNILPELQSASDMDNAAQQRTLTRLRGEAQLRTGRLAAAAAGFADLAKKTQGAESIRYATMADILAANGDGMYVVSEPYPPMAGLLGDGKVLLKPGPASLTDPLVMQAALRDRAKKEIETARQLLEAAQQGDASDPAGPHRREQLAAKAWDRADALAPNISYSYRVEAARRKIVAARKEADQVAHDYQQGIDGLGKEELSPQQYRGLVAGLIRQLDHVEGTLKGILEIAKPYPRDLVMEIQWAESDLRNIQKLRQVLSAELNANS